MKSLDITIALVVIVIASFVYIDKCAGKKEKATPCPEIMEQNAVSEETVAALQVEASDYHYRNDSLMQVRAELERVYWKQYNELDSLRKKLLGKPKTVTRVDTVWHLCDSLAIEYADYQAMVRDYVLRSDSVIAAAWDEKETLLQLSEQQAKYISYQDSTLKVLKTNCRKKCGFFRRVFNRCQ